MKIHLAPMEGVIDPHLRALLTRMGGYTQCVTEFIRVVDRCLPARVFYRYCPELLQGSKTAAGTPVIVQLLGGVAQAMAENARMAASLGAPGIDINFGCPSRFVNRKAGGAVLLKEPDRIYEITRAVRLAVPAETPVSAKIRLGFDDTDLALDNAHAVQQAGATYLTVHARTKRDGYRPPARWEWLARIRQQLTIPIIANGDIYTVEDYYRCREIGGCESVMLGRGALARPDLAQQIYQSTQTPHVTAAGWAEILPLLIDLSQMLKDFDTGGGNFVASRVKQWLAFLKGSYSEAQLCFNDIRTLKKSDEVVEQLTSRLSRA